MPRPSHPAIVCVPGLGNAFLSNIQAVDAIFHVTRAFDVSAVRRCTAHIVALLKLFDLQPAEKGDRAR
jgi:hypothetical protein